MCRVTKLTELHFWFVLNSKEYDSTNSFPFDQSSGIPLGSDVKEDGAEKKTFESEIKL